jgi:hypothetical protein
LSKGRDFAPIDNVTYAETEHYFSRIARARKTYLDTFVTSSFLYEIAKKRIYF